MKPEQLKWVASCGNEDTSFNKRDELIKNIINRILKEVKK